MRSYGSYGYNILKHALPGVSETDASELTIQLAYKFRLPCRLRFPGVVRFDIPSASSAYVAILNEIELPSGTTIEESMNRVEKDESKLRSIAVAVFERPKPSAEFLKTLAQGKVTDNDGVRQKHEELSLTTLNRIVVAHGSVANIDFASSSYPIILGDSLELKVWVYTPVQHKLSDDELKSLAELQPLMSLGEVSLHGVGVRVGDLTAAHIEEIRRVFTRLDEQVFDEFEHACNYFMHQGEEVISLLMAVVALEAAHSAFLRQYLVRYGLENQWIGTYLREQGFSSTLPITAKVFMRQDNQPTDEELKACLNGVTIRNAIMHGNPQMRNRMDQIHDARRNVLAIKRRLVDELEHLLAQPDNAVTSERRL